MLSLSQPVDVVVIDEIQMIGDAQRGASWTNAVMGLMAKEIHLCGEETVVPVITKLVAAMGDELVIHRYERLTPLKVLDQSLEGDLSKIEDGDCVVSFSRAGIFALKKVIEEKRGKRCAVVYGALPPETRSEQAKLFNEPGNGIDVMVASDAVGMGLNL
jgi:ATP-dependent RNA helicase SUPV3L1/SUV3